MKNLSYYIPCYYELTLFGDPQLTIKTPREPEPEWISPTGFADPQSSWDTEPLAYDRDTDTKAGCTLTQFGWTWTLFLELFLSSPIPCNKSGFGHGTIILIVIVLKLNCTIMMIGMIYLR